MNVTKPNFGAAAGEASAEVPQPVKAKRPEAGAIWERISKKSQSKFMSISLNLSKSKLQEILNKESGETVSLGFVAFPNEFKQENDKRPNFRIYEDIPQNETRE